MKPVSIADRAGWLRRPELQKLLAALSENGEEARIAGGAVRNALLGEPVTDIDIATTNLPDETERLARAAGFRSVPTGKEHGTVTVIAGGVPYEVTTLRADVETDGRHARVVFGRDWGEDAARRDFTVNALYAEADGTLVDLVGGLADLESRTLRFIGDAETRIREDFLRILRFFRFFARYGAGRPDAEGVKACARLKHGLSRLSAERVWAELKKLLSASDPGRALLWMRQTGVLSEVLPETEKWGIDAVPGLVMAERALGWDPDPMLRLMAMVPPDGERLAALGARLRLSRAEAARLARWADATLPAPETSDPALGKLLYRRGAEGVSDRLRLALAAVRARPDADLVEAAGYARLVRHAGAWRRPKFPLSGDDLAALGMAQGKAMGEVLRRLEDEWVDAGFTQKRGALLERAARLVESSG